MPNASHSFLIPGKSAILFGIGTGFGFGLIYLPAIVSVTTYFEKKRSLATGIAVCGSGFGTFIFAPLINLLLTEYGWRGAMLIISAIVLECIIFGALFRPLEYEVAKSELNNKIENKITIKVTPPKTDLTNSQECVEISNGHSSKLKPEERPRSMTLMAKPQKMLTLADSKTTTNYKLSRSQPALNSSQYEPLRQQYGSQHLKRSRPVIRPDAFYQYSLQNLSVF